MFYTSKTAAEGCTAIRIRIVKSEHLVPVQLSLNWSLKPVRPRQFVQKQQVNKRAGKTLPVHHQVSPHSRPPHMALVQQGQHAPLHYKQAVTLGSVFLSLSFEIVVVGSAWGAGPHTSGYTDMPFTRTLFLKLSVFSRVTVVTMGSLDFQVLLPTQGCACHLF